MRRARHPQEIAESSRKAQVGKQEQTIDGQWRRSEHETNRTCESRHWPKEHEASAHRDGPL